jgi:hypothetical protein
MDLFNTNAAHSLHAQEAQRVEREREYRRVAHERAAVTAQPETSAKPRRQHGFRFGLMFRGRVRSAQ